MALKHAAVTERREDFSRYMVHLTRDDREATEWHGMTARENFDNILLHLEIAALAPHCLHRKKVPSEYRDNLKVCCFTETPLDQIEHLIGSIPGRQIKLEPYGFVFPREFMLLNGAQQVTAVNCYSGNGVRDGYDAILETAIKLKFKNRSWKTLAFVSAMHEGYDFSWEREWRIRGMLKFTLDDLKYVILPDDDDQELIEDLVKKGISYICPGWTYERIADELSAQQRRTKKILTPKPKIIFQPKKLKNAGNG